MSTLNSMYHHDPIFSMIMVFGVNLALPLLMALGFKLRGLRSEVDRETCFSIAKGALVVCVLMQVLSASYHARLFAGTTETATVTRMEIVRGAKGPYCKMAVESRHGEMTFAVVGGGSCSSGGIQLGAHVPIRTIAGSEWFAQAGERATAHVMLMFGLFPLMMLMMWWFLLRSPKPRKG